MSNYKRFFRTSLNAIDIKILIQYFIIIFSILFPVFYVIIKKSVLYDEMRHFLFIVPPLACLGGIGLNFFINKLQLTSIWIKFSALILLICYMFFHVYLMIVLHPYQYVYYNHLIGGLKGAYNKFETEYWGCSYKEAINKLTNLLQKQEQNFPNKQFLIMVTAHPMCATYYFPDNFTITNDLAKADFYISTTRFNLHKWNKKPIKGKKIVQIERFNVPLIIVKDRRKFKNLS